MTKSSTTMTMSGTMMKTNKKTGIRHTVSEMNMTTYNGNMEVNEL